jgi:GAF domain-containing protein
VAPVHRALTERGSYGSVHALPLRLRGQAIGTLNLFHDQPGPLPAADLALGQALADVATVGILSERAIRRGEVVNERRSRIHWMRRTGSLTVSRIRRPSGAVAQFAAEDLAADGLG